MNPYKVYLRVLVFLAVIGCIRALGHFVRLAILAAMGLAGLYMMHLLAQDYNRIRRPAQAAAAVAKALLRGKRDVDGFCELNNYVNTVNGHTPETSFDNNWSNIFKMDPNQCVQSFICQTWAEPVDHLNIIERNIVKLMKMVSTRNAWVYNQVKDAINLGKQSRNALRCRQKFRQCPYSLNMMLSLLKLFSGPVL